MNKAAKIFDYITENQDSDFCNEALVKEFNVTLEKANDLIFDWALFSKATFIEKHKDI